MAGGSSAAEEVKTDPCLSLTHSSTLLVGKTGLEQAKKLLVSYKQGETKEMTPQLWKAKKIVDSTLHPGKV